MSYLAQVPRNCIHCGRRAAQHCLRCPCQDSRSQDIARILSEALPIAQQDFPKQWGLKMIEGETRQQLQCSTGNNVNLCVWDVQSNVHQPWCIQATSSISLGSSSVSGLIFWHKHMSAQAWAGSEQAHPHNVFAKKLDLCILTLHLALSIDINDIAWLYMILR